MKVDPVVTDALLFLLAIWPAGVLGMVLHEAGHAIAARAVGLTVLSFGVGYRKLLLRIPLGGAVFYVCWPISGGLQLSTGSSLDQPVENVWVITAGLIANILGLVAGVLAWVLGWHSPLLAAWIAASAWLILIAAFPQQARSTGEALSDGLQLLRFVRRNRPAVRPYLGAWLAYNRSIIKLFETIGHPAGAALYHLDAATFEAGLCNFEQARRDLEASRKTLRPLVCPSRLSGRRLRVWWLPVRPTTMNYPSLSKGAARVSVSRVCAVHRRFRARTLESRARHSAGRGWRNTRVGARKYPAFFQLEPGTDRFPGRSD